MNDYCTKKDKEERVGRNLFVDSARERRTEEWRRFCPRTRWQRKRSALREASHMIQGGEGGEDRRFQCLSGKKV